MNKAKWTVMLILAIFAGFSLMPGSFAKGGQTAACMSDCNACASICKKTEKYCKSKGGEHANPEHISRFEECIKSCTTAADLIRKHSAGMAEACGHCVDTCGACADSCESFKGDKMMQNCARECRECADACKKMSS